MLTFRGANRQQYRRYMSAAAPTEPRRIQLAKLVAVFGGDARVLDLEGMLPGDIRVDGYLSRDSDAERLAASIKAGGVTHVVFLVRWLGHASYRYITSLSKAAGIRVIVWKHGLGRLEQELPGLVADGSALPDEDCDALIGIGEAEPEVSTQRRARDAGMTVACFQLQHDDCAYRGKRKIKCGCECHAHDVVDADESKVASAPPAPFSATCERVLEVLGLDPSKTWMVTEIAVLLDAKEEEHHEAIRHCVASLIDAGDLVALGTIRVIPSSVSAVRLPAPQIDRQATYDLTERYMENAPKTSPALDILSLLPPERRKDILLEALGGVVHGLVDENQSASLGELIAKLVEHAHWDSMKQLPATLLLRARQPRQPAPAPALVSNSIEPKGHADHPADKAADKLRNRIVKILREAAPEGVSATEIAKATRARHPEVSLMLRELKQMNEVRMTGAGRASRWHANS